jgi:hypothetical protein
LLKIAKQIQVIQATKGGKAKRPAKANGGGKAPTRSVQPKPARPPKEVIAAAPSQLGAANRTTARLEVPRLVMMKPTRGNPFCKKPWCRLPAPNTSPLDYFRMS